MIAGPADFAPAARRRLPRFLRDYLDGGAFAESTMHRNEADLADLHLRQRVLRGSDTVDLTTALFGRPQVLPVALGPVGLTGMYARRGEAQVARAAAAAGVPYCPSTVSLCPIEEIARAAPFPWLQLYVTRDRGFLRDLLARAADAGIETLVLTVDLPLPGIRYRDAHSGLSGRFVGLKRLAQALAHPGWALDVGVQGKPHDLGNVSAYLGKRLGLDDYVGWLAKNFDPGIGPELVDQLRRDWPGKLVIKGILEADDARDMVARGADGIVVSNHGGRQLDSVLSTARALPRIVEAVGGRATVLVDGGVRTGLDVVKLLCLGADAVMLGRAYVYALTAEGQAGVERLLAMIAAEMRVVMTLVGVSSIAELGPALLDDGR